MSIFTAKINAFLHDPVDKPFILMQGESHLQRAKKLAGILGLEIEQMACQGADHLASAAERAFLPKYAGKTEWLQVKFLQSAEVVHPLSGKRLQFSQDKIPELNNVRKIVEDTMSIISSQISGVMKSNPQAFYLYLWRNLLPLLQQSSPAGLRELWGISPADTRMPDHSIFEHLKIVSACFNSFYDHITGLLNSQCAFLLFTLGPVQSFIAQARKTQDLYWGSFLLSFLSWVAIREVIQEYGPDAVIFPELNGHPLVDHWLKTEKGVPLTNDNSDQFQLPALPNRFLAIIPADEVKEAGEKAEEAVRREFKLIAELILQRNKINKPGGFDSQVNNFLEVYWVAVPWPDGWQEVLTRLEPYFSAGKTTEVKELLDWVEVHGEYPPNAGTAYSLIYAFTEKALGSRKNSRQFSQLEEKGRKCSTCGSRNVLFYRNGESRYRGQEAIQLPASFPLKYAQEGEGLCGICFTKRCADEYFAGYFKNVRYGGTFEDFPSTAEMALADFKEKLLRNNSGGFERYVTTIKRLFGEKIPTISFLPRTTRQLNRERLQVGNIDAEWFIEDNLTPRAIKKQLSLEKEPETEKVEQAKEFLRELVGKEKYTRYFALLMLDGDNMGKWLKGDMAPCFEDIYHSDVWARLPEDFKERLQGKKRSMTPALHAAVSTALRNYSLLFVRRIVEEEHLGKLVYAGGDDVVALVNLKDLLDVMVKLRASFSGHVSWDGNEGFVANFNLDSTGFVFVGEELILTMGNQATASTGVCIAHYKTPLREVIKQARRMEEIAKDEGGRDAFAIALLKHSGETRQAVFKWKYGWTGNEGTAGFLKELTRAIRDDRFSDRFTYHLKNEFGRLFDSHRRAGLNDLEELLRGETKRLLTRSCKLPSRTKEERVKREQEIENFSSGLYNLCLESDLLNFINFLDIAVFLAREAGWDVAH